MVTLIRFWFSIGQADAYSGVWDCAPLTANTLAMDAYRRGQMVAAGTARRLDCSVRPAHWYARNRAMVSGKLR